MAEAEIERREAAHRETDDVSARDSQMSQNADEIVGRDRLRVRLRLPASVVPAELMDEHERETGAGRFVIQRRPVCARKRHCYISDRVACGSARLLAKLEPRGLLRQRSQPRCGLTHGDERCLT